MSDNAQTRQLVAVFHSRPAAVRAAAAARDVGASDVRVDAAHDERLALEAEMRDEMEHTIVGPGNIGPFTKEMTKGIGAGVAMASVIGAAIALPFAMVDLFGLPLWLRVVIAAVVGGFAGATVGFMLGGGLTPTPEKELAAEEGVVVVVTVADTTAGAVERALRRMEGLIRLDAATGGQPQSTRMEEPDHTLEDLRDRAVQGEGDWSHVRSEDRQRERS